MKNDTPKADVVPTPAVRPYRRPKLEHLGSVKDLTLGGAGSAGEVVGMMAM